MGRVVAVACVEPSEVRAGSVLPPPLDGPPVHQLGRVSIRMLIDAETTLTPKRYMCTHQEGGRDPEIWRNARMTSIAAHAWRCGHREQNALRRWRGGETGCGRSKINHKMCDRREQNQKLQRQPPPIRTWRSATGQCERWKTHGPAMHPRGYD